MQSNAHNEPVPDTVIAAIEASLDTQLQALAPYATPLTAEDRRDLLKTGPKTFQFVELAYKLAGQNPQLLSKYFDMESFTKDYRDVHNLTGILSKSRQVTELLEDIVMAAGSDAQHHSLDAYADFRAADARNVPEARAPTEELRAAYPHKGRKSRKDEAAQA